MLKILVWIISSLGLFAQEAPTPPEHQIPGLEHGVFVNIPAGRWVVPQKKEGLPGQRALVIDEAFWMGKYEVTQALWQTVMGSNPSFYKGADHPVENVSWLEVNAFIDQLNQRFPQYQFRLPSETEWEVACRAGAKTAYHFGETAANINDYAWTRRNAGKRHHAVGQKRPNDFGLFDMHGNIWEWCSDSYTPSHPPSPAASVGPVEDSGEKVYRGGSFHYHPVYCRADYRLRFKPDYRSIFIGLRLVMTMKEVTP